ncbi:MAG: hypothetical protein H6905_09290 [Hyphomicrobiales bacterium]|nr:hypothetical protein [Hyphomicrobiales bacterium]
MLRALTIIVTVTLVISCTAKVESPEAQVKIPGVSVDVGGGGDFCPPGQAKKGKC